MTERHKAIIQNCNLGHGVSVRECPDGRADIVVDPAPAHATDDRCVALREFMERTAVAWLEQVAPHRLDTRALSPSPAEDASDEPVSFAWTAANGRPYPPYVNLTGNRLRVRGEPSHGEVMPFTMGWIEGTYVSVELPDEAIESLRQALSRRPADDEVTRQALRAEVINTPETADFMAGVPIEAAHQRERWGSNHDAGKTPEDWFWLIGYLAQKALRAQNAGDPEKAKHHTISTAAALANWHCALSGTDTSMRPGIEPPQEQAA